MSSDKNHINADLMELLKTMCDHYKLHKLWQILK